MDAPLWYPPPPFLLEKRPRSVENTAEAPEKLKGRKKSFAKRKTAVHTKEGGRPTPHYACPPRSSESLHGSFPLLCIFAKAKTRDRTTALFCMHSGFGLRPQSSERFKSKLKASTAFSALQKISSNPFLITPLNPPPGGRQNKNHTNRVRVLSPQANPPAFAEPPPVSTHHQIRFSQSPTQNLEPNL